MLPLKCIQSGRLVYYFSLNVVQDEKQKDVMERLIKVRTCKRQVLDMLDQIKANQDQHPPDKQMLTKLINSYDGFKDQEEKYLDILKQILVSFPDFF